MNRDDDIVRALGFVSLYAAYVEESVDAVMERLAAVKAITDRDRRKPTSAKIKWCKKRLKELDSGELNQISQLLDETRQKLEKRNEVVHGRIFAGHGRSDELMSCRPNIPTREVTSTELYDLADDLFTLQAKLPYVNMFATNRAIIRNESNA